MSVCAQWCRVPSSSFRSSSIAVSFRRSGSVVCHAKKKGKKGGKQKKGSLLGSVPKKSAIQPWQTTEVIMQHLLMVESYRRAAGKPLMENVEIEKVADIIYEAPFAVLAHNRFAEGVKDEESVFTYANKAALDAFEAEEFSEFVGQLSSSAVAGLDPDIISEREGVLTNTAQGSSTSEASSKPSSEASSEASNATEAKQDDAAAEGETDDEDRERKVGAGWDAQIIEGSGWRVGLKGRKILIDFELFNIYSPTGVVVGQAARFPEYKLEDGKVVKFSTGGVAVQLPTAEDLTAAQAAIDAQGDEVRRLKEAEGKTNSDPEVKEAVAELLKRKDHLAALEEAAAGALEPAA